MADILTQSEIDSLLAAITSGEMSANELKEEEDKKKVKLYDFKRALRFSKDQLRGLSRIHDNYSRMLTTYLSAQLRTFVKIEVAAVEQLPYEEFIRSIPTTTILNVFSVPPLEGRMVMEVNPKIAFGMIDRLMGGIGVEAEPQNRSLTEIEALIMERIFRRTLDFFRDAWKGVAAIEPQLDFLETNPQFMQIVSPNETVAVISLDTEIGETSGMINLCLPHVVIEDILPKLTAHHMLSNKKSGNTSDRVAVKKRLKRARLPITVELGTCHITLKELTELSAGDVIPLDQAADAPLVVKLGKRPKFLAQAGTVKGRLAVQIQETIDEEDDEDERQ